MPGQGQGAGGQGGGQGAGGAGGQGGGQGGGGGGGGGRPGHNIGPMPRFQIEEREGKRVIVQPSETVGKAQVAQRIAHMDRKIAEFDAQIQQATEAKEAHVARKAALQAIVDQADD